MTVYYKIQLMHLYVVLAICLLYIFINQIFNIHCVSVICEGFNCTCIIKYHEHNLCRLLEIINIIIVNNNISGPKIYHWGTPRLIGQVYHCTSSSLTDCLQLVEYYCCELHSNGSWLSH